MAQRKEDFQLEEYKQIRDDITDLERAMTQLFAVAVATSVTILSAVGAFFFKIEPEVLEKLSAAYAYPFLGPEAILIPILFLLVSHRRDIHRFGTYLLVFYEEHDFGPMWEIKVTRFREKKKGESLDVLPVTFWGIYVISVIGFIYALSKVTDINCQTALFPGSLIIVTLVLMAYGHYKFRHASTTIRDDYYKIWKEIDRGQDTK